MAPPVVLLLVVAAPVVVVAVGVPPVVAVEVACWLVEGTIVVADVKTEVFTTVAVVPLDAPAGCNSAKP